MRRDKRNNIVKFPVRYIIEIRPKHIIAMIGTIMSGILILMQISDWMREKKASVL